MPFKDKERKREWMKGYMREYMRCKRAGQPNCYFPIFERDNFRCQYCGRTPRDGVQLQVDHITPKWLGGADTEYNLITACAPCNASKSGKLLRKSAEEAIRAGLNIKTPQLDAGGNPIPWED